jgi:hypothetical protein
MIVRTFNFVILLVASCFCIKKSQQARKNKLLSFFICCLQLFVYESLKFLGNGGNRHCWGNSSFSFSFLD